MDDIVKYLCDIVIEILLDHEEEHQYWVKSNTQVTGTLYIHPKF